MLILHGNWTESTLRLWAESLEAFVGNGQAHGHERGRAQGQEQAHEPGGGDAFTANAGALATATLPHVSLEVGRHPFAADPAGLREILIDWIGGEAAAALASAPIAPMTLSLPRIGAGPAPSDRLAAAVGADEQPIDPLPGAFALSTIAIEPAAAIGLLLALESADADDRIELGRDLRYWAVVGRFAVELLAAQRFIPTLSQAHGEGLQATWQPWLHDDPARKRVGALLRGMPPACRAVDDAQQGQPWLIIDDALRAMVDSSVRRTLRGQDYEDAIDGRDPADQHVAWLAGLLGAGRTVAVSTDRATDLLRDVSRWVSRLDESVRPQPFRLCLRLTEPIESHLLPDLEPVDESVRWRLSLHLRGVADRTLIIDAPQLWSGTAATARAAATTGGRPDELLITELGRAARICPLLEPALSGSTPTGLDLSTEQAWRLLSEYRPLLEESGIAVEAPAWWDEPASRLGARLHIESAPMSRRDGSPEVRSSGASRLGLHSLIEYRWQLAVGDQPLSREEFDRLAAQPAPLVRVRGQWVQLDPEQVQTGLEFLREEPSGTLTLLEAIQMAHGAGGRRPALPVSGVDATGWVGDLLSASDDVQRMPTIEQPEGLDGQLRPYQNTGLSWLAFLDQLGLGACLADDMGLGKTVQLIALLLHERNVAREIGGEVGPTLLLVPTSLIGNWMRELNRFAPALRPLVHHGPDRATGEAFLALAPKHDVVISTYGLVTRDRELLERVQWHRVALDEAQLIKNPPTKQTSAIRALRTARRVALTGTPVENRLSELWSIMEFCNPGYLGSAAEFRRRFGVPVERHRDQRRAEMLRRLVRPFILRRLKTDPTVINDLPPCVQTREYANLTTEQASLYQQIVSGCLEQVDRAEGMQRRGLVLATLVKLKQVCDHPSLLNGGAAHAAEGLAARSGKARRLVEMLEEVFATGERALIFTQFRQMGHLLSAVIRHELDTEVLFLHGGTPPARRQQMVDRFQEPDGTTGALILSLRAGGVGLNLTAATHVFHFDRWWNPAVENQATDRAFRIGQTRTVHVHKFVCTGTLEERIDQMIEQKTELARNIIGSGEQWLSELSSTQLRDVLMLRQGAMMEQES